MRSWDAKESGPGRLLTGADMGTSPGEYETAI